MTRLRILVLAVAACLLVSGTTAVAATTATDSVAGIQVGFQPDAVGNDDLSSFAGALFGDLPGKFQAGVLHDDLSDPDPQITGGTFLLRSGLTGTTVEGSFTSGDITLVSSEPGCGKQVFSIDAELEVVLNASVPGSATVENLRLVHHRAQFGACVTFFATVSGFRVVTFTFP
jgi:hypothetical protein